MTAARPDTEQAVDPARIRPWLDELGIAVSGELTIDRVGLGQSNLTYVACDADGHKWVLRRPPLGTLLASAHDVVREARIMAALRDTTVPVPSILGVSDDAAVCDAPLVLMEHVDGQVLDHLAVARTLSSRQRHDIAASLIDTLATVHTVDLEAVGLNDLASHKPYAARQLKRWSSQWEKSKTRESSALDNLTERLWAAAPPQRELTLVHGDFHLNNLITDPATGRIRAVLDWELATLGDPLADMGSLLAYWAEPGKAAIPGFDVTTLDGFPSHAELAERYLSATGRDAHALRYWHVLGLWKVAVIAEGVLRRALDEPKNRAASGTPTTDIIDGLVDRARRIADDAGI
ncbi:phosphotransferase family protein [Stackebrandtia nassauensis]|uniref:Aminoglycoside phosphotransferase n=1 Tax=Stackebrandtia nassauensis (strain DSM 44728 / CIP 108903 / NRRL B-16338 / NBRC 102104 / LLR-40K-21) TaxID=446470 RepID=D3Q9A1_STANL|nr:phosphotransferase family protein [Stackebrandtia nassauensis]ADD42583.1 aminoglycoside phosphotransferase [Stackebrandtia nassauensis DSM 44728]